MVKKWLALLLALVMILSFAACGSSDDDDEEEEKTPKKETVKTPEEEEEEEQEEENEEEENTDKTPVTDSFLLLDSEDFLVEISDLHVDELWGYAMTVRFENHTEKACTLSFEDTALNDIVATNMVYLDAKAGGTVTEECYLLDADPETFGLKEFTKLDLTLNIFDSETFETITEEAAVVYPLGESKHIPYERKPQATDVVLLENADFQIVLTGISPDDFFGYTLHLYVINHSEQNLMFSLDETKLNDVDCFSLWATTIPSHKQAFTDISWMEDTLKEKNITEIQSILLEFYVADADDWMADPIAKEKVEITP